MFDMSDILAINDINDIISQINIIYSQINTKNRQCIHHDVLLCAYGKIDTSDIYHMCPTIIAAIKTKMDDRLRIAQRLLTTVFPCTTCENNIVIEMGDSMDFDSDFDDIVTFDGSLDPDYIDFLNMV